MTKLLIIFAIGINLSAFGMDWVGGIDLVSDEVIERFDNANCGGGKSGWWLKLPTKLVSLSEEGGINKETGKYFGCGKCGSCRSKLKWRAEKLIEEMEEQCAERRAKVFSTYKGAIREVVEPTGWIVERQDITIDCRKWIPC